MYEIAIICASDGKNLELTNSIAKCLSEDLKKKVKIVNLIELDLPMYTNKNGEIGIKETQKNEIEELVEIKKFIFVAPEYNGGIPPTLTNFFCWCSTSFGDDWRKLFKNKDVSLASFSGSTAQSLINALTLQASFLGFNVKGRKIQSHYGKVYTEKQVEELCLGLLDSEK